MRVLKKDKIMSNSLTLCEKINSKHNQSQPKNHVQLKLKLYFPPGCYTMEFIKIIQAGMNQAEIGGYIVFALMSCQFNLVNQCSAQ